jgi:hypothetical protein
MASFEIEPGPPAWAWEEYEDYLHRAWAEVLAADPTEAEVQSFLEHHPCLVPGGEGGGESIGGHHGPFPDVLITQPELSGLRRPVPDFMWISKVSGQINPVLIEIEAPAKPWFTAAGVMTASLSQAVGQLGEWRAWFGDEVNRLNFFKRYGISEWLRDDHEVKPVYCLIYGRRAEFSGQPGLQKKRAALEPEWARWMTYDRLYPNAGSRNAACVSVGVNGWRVKTVPPTLRLGPNMAETLIEVPEGWEEAIDASPLIAADRKEFLLARLPYWREWARVPSKGAYSLGQWE